jgi:integrase
MKRSRGEGSIQPRGAAWRIRYRVNEERFEKTVQGTRVDAAKALREALKSGDDGKHVAPAKLTFRDWAKDWLALKAQRLAGQTIERYANILRLQILPVLDGLPLQKIKASDIDRLYSSLTLAPRTNGLVHIILKACFRTAVKRKLLQSNPVEDAEKPNDEDQEAGTVLDEDELAKLVRAFKGHTLYPIVATAAYTGARRNEILALRWIDIDLDRHMVSITRSLERTKAEGIKVKGPKKARHARTIQIDAGLASLLRAERERHLKLIASLRGVAAAILPTEALCFPAVGPNLTAFRPPNAVTTVFHDYAAKLGLDLRFHDLRASHETILLDKGVPVHVVAKRCGHDPAMLLKVYAKRTRKADIAAASVIETLTADVFGANAGASSQSVPPTPLK